LLADFASVYKMILTKFRQQLNEWGKARTPFLFMIDFELEKPLAFPLPEINRQELWFNLNGFSSAQASAPTSSDTIEIQTWPISFADYQQKFDSVFKHLEHGNSFLTNLTIRSPIKVNKTLLEIFSLSRAKYKLLYKNEFLFFSPETFVRIEKGKIYSYPMKGTIDFAVANAEWIILNDEKEKAEHVTIVDLIRNDLSLVSKNVQVSKFRYVDQIKTHNKTLLQVSSEIVGDLPDDYLEHLGDILTTLLPAGSVTGAPKKKTLEIISEAEKEKRNYYAGVMGYFDGEKLESTVMIRFIENVNGQLYYRSGGGITTQSDCKMEYEEALAKIYVPIV
jgi:para-aminobenzoate synthetase component I